MVLDRQRLGKQRLECKQIITALELLDQGMLPSWHNHPAVLMWRGHIGCLAEYGAAVCIEWSVRGYEDNMLWFFLSKSNLPSTHPWWMGNDKLHSSHRSRLLMKQPDWYSQFNWSEQPGLEYWWPTKQEQQNV